LLGQSSGFQSWQYRVIEFLVGNKNAAMIRAHQQDAAAVARLEAVRQTPSIYDLTIQLLHRRGLDIDKAILERDVSLPHSASDSVLNAWSSVYRDPTRYWELYELAEKLVDFEDYFRRWRFNHVTTVERIIGFKRGTGGTSGVSYLRKMLDVVLFPELWQVRTEL
jgi:tryptophan 2,3-dioxygenase